MGTLLDAIALASSAVHIFVTDHSGEFFQTVAIALALAALCWLAASKYSRLWNLRFQATRGHHILCFIAAVCTLLFALLFSSVKYTKETAERSVDNWSARLVQDSDWAQGTFETAYEEIKKLGREDPARLKHLWEQEHKISLNHLESRRKDAEVHANAAVVKFRSDHPFLSKILWANVEIPAKRIAEKMNEFFESGGKTFQAEWSVNIAATEIKKDLQAQTDRIVPVARTLLAVLFFIVQFVPFGLIGYAAYKDLKVTT